MPLVLSFLIVLNQRTDRDADLARLSGGSGYSLVPTLSVTSASVSAVGVSNGPGTVPPSNRP